MENKTIRIGKLTFGVMLILVGIMIFVQTVTNLDILRYVFMLWPLVLICLGVETLLYRNKENTKYDILGGVFTFIIIGIVLVFSMVNYGINKVLYDEDIKSAVIDYISDVEIRTHFANVLTINNISGNNKVSVKINEIETQNDTEVRIKINTNSKELKMNNKSIYDYMNINYNTSEITLLDNFEEYESIEITIITKSAENIKIK